jgi:hypothetical protein
MPIWHVLALAVLCNRFAMSRDSIGRIPPVALGFRGAAFFGASSWFGNLFSEAKGWQTGKQVSCDTTCRLASSTRAPRSG